MPDSIASLSSARDSNYGQGQRRQSRSAPPGEPNTESESAGHGDAGDPRLVIEDDPTGGPVYYKTIDGRTGAVLRRLPSEQVLKMGEATTYVAGQIISARA
jgi:hypothetical protein